MEIAAQIGIHILSALFAIGMIGSATVIVLTSIEDSEVFFDRSPELGRRDDAEPSLHATAPMG